MRYKVKLDAFEGPFDLLVYLIENARMNIYDIQVAEITAGYMSYIEKAKSFDIALTSEFLVLAATLIEIKSKMLLPRIIVDDDGNTELEDPRSELVSRLLEYKRFKNAAEALEKCEELALRSHEKPKEDPALYTNEPDVYLDLDIKKFIKAFKQFLMKKQKLEKIKKDYDLSSETRCTTEEKIDFIKNIFKVKNKRTVNFKELLQEENDKYELVLTFSSVLEMARLRSIKLTQRVPFGDIKITDWGEKDGEQENDKVGL